MSDKNSDKKEFTIKRITTPHGDVPTVDSLLEALNVIVSRINKLSKNIDERLKYSGATIEASGYIEQNLLDTTKQINDLKNKLLSNSDQIEDINNNVLNLEKMVTSLENMTKNVLNGDFTPQTKSLEDIIEIKNITKSLKDNILELQRSLGEGPFDLKMIFWEYEEAGIKENLTDISGYENEKNSILSYFKILNLPKPVLDIDAKILVRGPPGTGKTTLVRAIAKDQKIKVIELNLPLIISLRPPKQVESLNTIFRDLKAKEDIKPYVLLLDNFEMLIKIQGNSKYLPLIETLIMEMGRVDLTKNKILIIAIQNGNEMLNERLLEEFNEKVEIKLPDQITRALILRKILNETNLEMDIDLEELSSKLAESEFTDGFSGKELREIMNIGKIQAFSNGNTELNEKYLVEAIEIIKSRQDFLKVSSKKVIDKVSSGSNVKIKDLEEEITNLKMLLTNSTRMMKHALRLALTDNYNFINRLFSHYEVTKKALSIGEIAQVTGVKEENTLKLLKKMPYRLLFPKIGEEYYVVFDKSTFEEILAELTLTI